MDWLIDLGNTRVKWAALRADGRADTMRALAHGDAGFAAHWQAALAPAGAGDRAWLAAVAAPPVQDAIQGSLRDRGLRVDAVRVRPDCCGLQLGYDDPAQLGVDRFLGLLGALEMGACLIVSIGSAVTIDLLDAGKRHHGGLIAATPDLQRQTLTERFPALDRSEGVARPFATNTADAIASGCLASTIGLIHGSWQAACRALDDEPQLLLCGGGADALGAAVSLPHRLCPQLVMDGLARYAMQAREQCG